LLKYVMAPKIPLS